MTCYFLNLFVRFLKTFFEGCMFPPFLHWSAQLSIFFKVASNSYFNFSSSFLPQSISFGWTLKRDLQEYHTKVTPRHKCLECFPVVIAFFKVDKQIPLAMDIKDVFSCEAETINIDHTLCRISKCICFSLPLLILHQQLSYDTNGTSEAERFFAI